jgi:hypothetical protein
MMVSIEKARHFVYDKGLLWEKRLFDYLFCGGSLAKLHESLLCYKNTDGGWANGIEHDIKCPDSNPISLEFLLTVIRDTSMPTGNLLDGTVEWLERNIDEDGSFKAPDTLYKYPHAWWMAKDINPTIPDSIVGNLKKLRLCTPVLEESAEQWVSENLTVEKVLANKWLFMAYHAFDYYSSIEESEKYYNAKQAMMRNILECAENATEKQYHTLFQFMKSRTDELYKYIPNNITDSFLDYLSMSQRDDGGWEDEHGLIYWQPYVTIQILCALKNFGII